MSVRRALVDCVVLSLQDACVFYPCCKGCFSRVDVEQHDTTRCRCSKCGYSCPREQVDYRYRLSLRVARDRCIFGVTVFGTCLNRFFGIHASGLQRLVQNLDGASTRSTLLEKAVQDCFIGRHFIFGIKVTESENGPLFGEPSANGSSSRVHFIASQMILPIASGLGGCTVVSYYRILLQKAAEYEQGSSRPPTTPLLLIPGSSFNNATLSASGFLSLSPQSSLTSTPPWQQSLGLVTSSAEQEESCSAQDSGEETSRQTDNIKTPRHAQRGCPGNREEPEERALSPLVSLERSSSNSPSFTKSPRSSIGKAVGNTPVLNTWFSPPPPGLNSSKAKEFSSSQLTETLLSSSLVWEDLPFSESLTEFLCEENKDVGIVSETEPHLKNLKQTARNNLEISSPDKNVSHKSLSVCQSGTQKTDSHSQILLDITKTPAQSGGDGHDLSDRVYKDPVRCTNKSQARNSRECYLEDDKASLLSFENEEEQLEEDTYNCSADLFSSSLVNDMSANQINTHAETVRTTTGAVPLLSKPSKQHLRREKDTHSTPDQKLKRKKCINRDSLIPGTQDFDFIPPSQSTPIVKAAVVTGSLAGFSPDSQDSCAFYGNQLSQCGRTENMVWSTTSSRHSHRFTPKRRFWKPDKRKNPLQAQRVQREALNQRINRSSDCDVTDNEVIVPPTPAAETRLSVTLRRRLQTENSRSSLGLSCKRQQGDGVHCKRTLLDQTLKSSERGFTQTGSNDSETVDEGSRDGSNCNHDENQVCDWSRDLFSDSV